MIRSVVTSGSRFNCVNILTIYRFNVTKPFRFGFLALVCVVTATRSSAGPGDPRHSQSAATEAHEHTNRLAHEKSPYLLQHAQNPVDWYPWGEEALDRARDEDKPILLSIGYAACHWCHVMAHESFEDDETAALMNERFVNVKVDRAERPDVDALYMDAVVSLTGQGGWPMTVFLTPEGEPFFGGTYYPPEPRHGLPSFRQLLVAVGEAYRDRRDDVVRQAGLLGEALPRKGRNEAFGEPITHQPLPEAA